MKKYILFGFMSAMLMLSSCDNFLDVTPKGQSVLDNTDEYLGLVAGVMDLYDTQYFNYYSGEQSGFPIINFTENNGGDYTLAYAGFAWDESVDRYQYMPGGETDLYTASYNRIARYNTLINNIGDAEGPNEDKVLGIAQAKIMRAYNYFILVNTYAKMYDKATAATDNGIILHTKMDLEADSKQYTVQEVYDFILDDIKAALPDLPERAEDVYRPDRYFGYALYAKVLLFMGDYEGALAAGLDALKSDYHQLKDYNTNYEELLASGFPESMMYSFVKNDVDDPENLLFAHGINTLDQVAAWISKGYIDLFDLANDLRFKFFFMQMGGNPKAEQGAYSMMVSNWKWNTSGIRLAEVYLMVAECYARTNEKDEALKYLNDLREKRFKKDNYQPATAENAEEALQLIRDERKRELLMSYNSYFDARRFCKEFGESLSKEVTWKNSAGEMETKTYTLSSDSPLLIFPFPQNAMNNSPLVQNTK